MNSAQRSGLLSRRHGTNITRQLHAFKASVTGARHPAVEAAAKVLVKEMKQQLSTKGGHAAPGEAPRKRTGRAFRSIATRIVDGVRRVGTSHFVLRLQEFGVTAAARAHAKVWKSKKKGGLSSTGRKGRRGVSFPPHPWARPALEKAKPKMGDAIATTLMKSGRKVLDG